MRSDYPLLHMRACSGQETGFLNTRVGWRTALHQHGVRPPTGSWHGEHMPGICAVCYHHVTLVQPPLAAVGRIHHHISSYILPCDQHSTLHSRSQQGKCCLAFPTHSHMVHAAGLLQDWTICPHTGPTPSQECHPTSKALQPLTCEASANSCTTYVNARPEPCPTCMISFHGILRLHSLAGSPTLNKPCYLPILECQLIPPTCWYLPQQSCQRTYICTGWPQDAGALLARSVNRPPPDSCCCSRSQHMT